MTLKGYLLSFSLCLCVLHAVTIQAQVTRWAYPGGGTSDDLATDIVQANDGGFVACINGGNTDEITFSVIKIDSIGNLVWFTEIDKDPDTETVHQIIPDQFSTGYILTGSANATGNPWVVHIDNAGNIINSSESWSDATPDASGINAQTVSINDVSYAVVTYQNDFIDLYFINEDVSELTATVSHDYPGDALSNELAITSVTNVPSENAFIISGNTTAGPFVYIFNSDGDSLRYVPFAADTVLVFAIDTTSNGGILATGVNADSSAVYFNWIDSVAVAPQEHDTVYTAEPYTVIGRDVLEMNDHNFAVLSTHFHPLGVRSVITVIDTLGDIQDENNLMQDAGEIDFASFLRLSGTENVFAAAGNINTFTVDNAYEYLIAKADSNAFPLCVYDCVWPGDANLDGTVTMYDLLTLGAGYAFAGTPRDFVSGIDSTEWTAQLATDWADDLPSGINAKYADVSGDGVIDDLDTAGINFNYELLHNNFSLRLSGGEEYPLWLNTAGITLHEGLNEIPIMLGTTSIPVENIYGLDFSISYSGPAIIDSTTVEVHFHDSWLGFADLNLLQLDYNKPEEHNIDAGVTRKDKNNTSGYGEIGKMSFVVEDNIAGMALSDSVVIFTISGSEGITANMSAVDLTSSVYSVPVATGLTEIENLTGISMYPNPSSGIFNLILNENLQSESISIKIKNLLGEEVYSEQIVPSSTEYQIQLSQNISNGMYLLELTAGGEIFSEQVVVSK